MRSPELSEVARGVWAWIQADGTWWVNNAGLIAGDDGDILFDTCATEKRTRRLLDAVSVARPDATLRWAVNSHAHGDHTYGNSLLPRTVTIIGHEHMRDTLAADPVIDGCPPFWSPNPDWGGVVKRLPDVAVAGRTCVWSGDVRVDLQSPGYPAHTTGDLVAWVPHARVLFTGDLLFAGLTPLAFMGSIDGALRSLDWVEAIEAETVVPGHGPVLAHKQISKEIQRQRDYYEFVHAAAEVAWARGASPLEAARELDLGSFSDWPDAERIVLNLHRAFADIEGRDVDVMDAFRDAVALHGGPLKTSV
jgi:cyclase